MKNEKIKITVGIIVIILLVVVLSILFYNTFINKNPAIVSNLEVSFSDSGVNIEDENKPTDVEEATPYKFKITNRSSFKGRYKVILMDNSENKDGIQRKYLNYQLTYNNVVVSSGNLNSIKNNILETRYIDPNSTNTYILKIFINNDSDFVDKSYDYSLRVEPVLE